MNNSLHVIPYGLIRKLDELKLLILKYNPLAISIQESKFKNNNYLNLKNYKCFYKNVNSETAKGSIYLPPECIITQQSLEDLINQFDSPFLLLGGFNGHNRLWGSNKINRMGHIIENIITKYDLVIMNNITTPTHLSFAYHTFSTIDLSISSSRIREKFEWSILEDLYSSDHYPIVLRLISYDNNISRRCRTIISNKQDIVNELADTFTANSSSLNYSQSFLKSKNYKEKITLNVNNNDESYNDNFSMVELISTLRMCKGSSPGPDLIHYEMLKNLSVENKKYLLDYYNFIWQKQTFPGQWREAIVIPIPKKGKDLLNKNNYRPISLTNCLCKILERMINRRLSWYLETSNFLNPAQSAFRKTK